MMRAAVTYLFATELLQRALTIPPDGKQEGLACAAFDTRSTDGTTDEFNLAPTIAPVVTRKGKQRVLHHSPTLKRRDNPTYGATRNNANPNTCGTTSMDSKRETKGPAHRWYDRRIQPRPNHSADGNSEGETEDTSPFSYTQETR